jgi:hypothetical protein
LASILDGLLDKIHKSPDDKYDISGLSHTSYEVFKTSLFEKYKRDFKKFFDIGTNNEYFFLDWDIIRIDNDKICIRVSHKLLNIKYNTWGERYIGIEVRTTEQIAQVLKYDIETYFFQSMGTVRSRMIDVLTNIENIGPVATIRRLELWKKMK